MRIFIFNTILASVSGLATFAQADQHNFWSRDFNNMMWGTGYGMYGGLMMFVFWGVVIALIVVAVRWFSNADRSSNIRTPSALDILQERFARGEIDEEEYRNRKSVLSERSE